MSRVNRLYRRLTDEELRLATLLGIASIPVTVVLSSGGEPSSVSGVPLLVVGVLVGYSYGSRPVGSKQAGIQAGLTASVGVVSWQLWYLVSVLAPSSMETAALFAVLVPVVVAIGVGVSLFLVAGSAIVSSRLVR